MSQTFTKNETPLGRPLRSKRRKQVAFIGLAVAAASFMALWSWWNHEANRRLQSRLDAIAARGEPVRLEQLRRAEPLSDEENAAVFYRRAAGLIDNNAPTPAQSNFDFNTSYPPFSRRWHRLMDAAIVANAQALAVARQARPIREADWGVDSPETWVNRTHLNSARNLANLLGDAALHAHLHNDDFEALERVRDARRLSRAIVTHPTQIDLLVAIGVEAVALDRLETLAPDMKIQAAGAIAPAGKRPASPQQVRSLISELLDEQPNDDYRRATIYERLWIIHQMRSTTRSIYVLQPMISLDMARTLSRFEVAMAAGAQPSAPAGLALLRTVAPSPSSKFGFSGQGEAVRWMTRSVSSNLVSNFDRVFVQDMRMRAERRMAAVSLATQLFRQDRGRWPTSLAELVPDYLPGAPIDPFTADAKPLGYVVLRGGLPDGGDRPLVYHTNDGTDHFALYGVQPPNEPMFSWTRGVNDQFRDLSRWSPPKKPPTTRPGGSASTPGETDEDDPDEADQPGNQP